MPNGRARAIPQEAPKRPDPLKQRLDTLLPGDFDSLDAMIEQALGRGQGGVRPGQAYPSFPDPAPFLELKPGPPTPPPVVQETIPPLTNTQLGQMDTGGAKKRGLPGWAKVEELDQELRHADLRPMPQDATLLRPPTARDTVATAPLPEYVAEAEQGLIGPPEGPEDRMGVWEASKGITASSLASMWEGILNVGQLMSGGEDFVSPGLGRPSQVAGAPTEVSYEHLAHLEDRVEDYQQRMYPSERATSFQEVLGDPSLVFKWGVPMLAQGLTTTGLIMGGFAFGAPGAFAAAFTLNYPEVVDELEEAGLDPKEARRIGAALNLPIAALDTALPHYLMKQVSSGLMTRSAAVAAMRQARRNMNKSAGRLVVEAGAKGSGIEALTEGSQEGITMAGGEFAKMFTEEDHRTFGEFVWQMVEGMAAGALPGGFMGGVAGASQAGRDRRDITAGLYEALGSMGEFGEEGVAEAHKMRETRLASLATEEAPAPGVTQPTEASFTEKRVSDIGPPPGTTGRRYTDAELAEKEVVAKARTIGEADLQEFLAGVERKKLRGFKEMSEEDKAKVQWASGEAQNIENARGVPAREKWAERVAMSFHDGRTLEELQSTYSLENIQAVEDRVAPSSVVEQTGDETQGVHPDEYTDQAPEKVPLTAEQVRAQEEGEWAAEHPLEEPPVAQGPATVIPHDVRVDARMDVEDLQVKEGGQYKRYGKQAAGKGLEKITEWRDDQAGVVSVWRGPPGKEFDKPQVINGHNRYYAAKRLRSEGKEVPPLRIHFIEAETLAGARATGARINIGEGRGTIWDAAEFFRGSGISSVEDVSRFGLTPDETMVSDGLALSNLIPELYQMAFGGELAQGQKASGEKGVMIGEAGLTEAEQRGLLEQFNKRGIPGLDDLNNQLLLARGEAARGDQDSQIGLSFGGEAYVKGLMDYKIQIKKAVDAKIKAALRTARYVIGLEREGSEEYVEGALKADKAEATKARVTKFNGLFMWLYSQDAEFIALYDGATRQLAETKKKGDRDAIIKEASGEIFERLETAYSEGEAGLGERNAEAARPGPAPAGEPVPEPGGEPTVQEPKATYQVIRNPAFEGHGMVPTGQGYVLVRAGTDVVVGFGSFAEMQTKKEEATVSGDVLEAAEAAEAEIEAELNEQVLYSLYDEKQTNRKIQEAMKLRNELKEKLKRRGSVIRPMEIANIEGLENQLAEVEDLLIVLHNAADQFLGARREAVGEPSMITITIRDGPSGQRRHGTAPSPNFRREAAKLMREEWAEINREREIKTTAAVRDAATVWSSPTEFYNLSMNLDQWLDRLEQAFRDARAVKKPKRKGATPQLKYFGAVFPAEGAAREELIDEFRGLITHLAANLPLVQAANEEQTARLAQLMAHPWFSEEKDPYSETRPVGQKKAMFVKKGTRRTIDGKTVELGERRLRRDSETKKYYLMDKKHGRIDFPMRQQYRGGPDIGDQLTDAIVLVIGAANKRVQDWEAVNTGTKVFESQEEGVDTEDFEEMSKEPRGQIDLLTGEVAEDAEDVRLSEPQFEMQFTDEQRLEHLRRAHQTVSNYYGLWKAGEATERQMAHLLTAMNLVSGFNVNDPSVWGFTSNDYFELQRYFETPKKVKELDMNSGELLDYYGLDPTGVPGLVGAAGRGLVDYMPTTDMPGAGQMEDDAKLRQTYKEMMEAKGLAWMYRRGKIPSRRESIRTLGKAVMAPVSTGRTPLGRAWGRFYTHIRSIRTKWAYDMETVGHELGHSLMHLIWHDAAYTPQGRLSNTILRRWDGELRQFGLEYEQWQGPDAKTTERVEWFAEYVRRYISSREQTRAMAPGLTKFMEEELTKNEPGVMEALDWAEYTWRHWRNQTPESRILSQFMSVKEVKDDRAWSWITVPPLVRIKRAWIDLHVPFDTIVKTYNPGLKLTDTAIPLQENPAMLARLMGGSAAAGDERWMYGVTDAETGLRTSEGAEPLIIQAVKHPAFKGNDQEGFAQFAVFGAALRNIERAQVAIKRAEKWAAKLNKDKGEAGRFVVREAETEPGAFNVFDLRTDKVVGRRFKQYILGFSYKDSQEAIQNAKAGGYFETFMESMNGLYAYANAQLDWLVQMGALTEETAETVKKGSRYYVPMVPVIERLDQRRAEYQRAYPRHELAKVPGVPRRMRAPGSAAPKRNWIEQLYIDTQYLTLVGMRTQTVQALYNMTKAHRGTGVFLEAIATPNKATPVELKQMLNQLEKVVDSEIVDFIKENAGEEALQETLMVFAPGDYMNAMDVVRVRDPDTQEIKWLQVNDPELLGALLGTESQTPGAVKFLTMTKIARALRIGATLSPGFSLYRNPGRDSLQAWVMSEWGIKIGYDHIRAVYHMIGKDELYQKFLSSGAAFASLLDFNAKGIARKVQKAQRSKIVNVIPDVGEALKILGTWTENMNRFAEYERAYESMIGQGFGEMEARTRAAYAARDITVDFWRHGYQTAAIRNMVAFWNANLQGWNKLIRTAKENPARFAWRTFQGITVPSLLLWAVNHDDEDYKSLPQWLKDFFWLIPLDPGTLIGGAAGMLTGNPAVIAGGATLGHTVWDKMFLDELEGDDPAEPGTKARDLAPVVFRGGKAWIKFPKPFFLGQFFGTTAERALDYAVDQDGSVLDHVMSLTWNEVSALSPMPTGWRGVAEIISPQGYDTYRQRPLMGPEMAGRDRWTQYTPSTSGLARWVGKGVADITGGQGLSPIKIDHLLFSWFGTLMRDAVKFGDLGYRLTGEVAGAAGLTEEPWGQGVRPGKRDVQLLPLIGDLVQTWPYGSSSHVDEVYKLWDEADRKYGTYNYLLKLDIKADSEEAVAYLDRNPGLFGEYHFIAAAYAKLGMIQQQISFKQNEKGLTDKERYLAIAKLWEEKNDTARAALERHRKRGDNE